MFNTQILAGSSGQGGETQQSLKFNDDESQYLSWTPAAAGNRKTWTWSGWVKPSAFGKAQPIFSAYTSSTDYTILGFDLSGFIGGGDSLKLWSAISNSTVCAFTTNAVFRDPSAWYHIQVVTDTTQATSTDRVKLYVNGEQITSLATATYPSQNADAGMVNATTLHQLGTLASGTYGKFDGYLSDINFIDGQALDASSFGQFTNGYWKKKDYSGSYGTNGFHLTFADDVVSEGFNVATYRGTGANQSISGLGLSPDLLFLKSRSATYLHYRFDSVRGPTKRLTNTSGDESTTSTELISFDADGFTVGSDVGTNQSGGSMVAWCWDAGSGSPVSNTDGTITATVKANPAYGFSIISYTGDSVNNSTIGTGLNSEAEMVIIKNRTDDTANDSWPVWHKDIGTGKYLSFSTTGAAVTSSVWNDGGFTNDVISISSWNGINKSGTTYIGYAWHSVAGYSSIGSYSGTGSTVSVNTGFKAAWLLIKRTDTSGFSWVMLDNTRNPSGELDDFLLAETNIVETNNGTVKVLPTATGFDVTGTATSINASGGTYIYMAFADTREAAFWKDVSGQGNHWQPNNLDYRDSLIDSPANNFATFNALEPQANVYTFSEGNLKAVAPVSGYPYVLGTMYVASGKWYGEFLLNSSNGYELIGIETSPFYGSKLIGQGADGWGYATWNGTVYNNNSGTAYGNTYTTGDIIGVAMDLENNYLYFSKNGVWQNSGNPASGASGTGGINISSISGTAVSMGVSNNDNSNSSTFTANFGQDSTLSGARPAGGNVDANNIGDFAYPVPSGGYLALCSANLPTPTIIDGSEHFNTVLWSAQSPYGDISISGVNFQPDFVWVKSRPQAYGHTLFDSVRGVAKTLYSDSTSVETANSAYGYLSSFDADGFTGSAGSSDNSYFNYIGNSYVAWNWKAGGTSVSNTDGTITSQVSANTDAGFSVVSWVHSSTTSTIGHGLTTAPNLIILKSRTTAYNWDVGSDAIGWGNRMNLNSTAAAYSPAFWNSTAPTSSVFTYEGTGATNGDNMIAYCFANTEGYLKAGSYTGNGSTDGPFIYTGFRPAWVMIKNSSGTGGWEIHDNKRLGYNPADETLDANTSAAEATGNDLDILSNGFKVRNIYGTSNTNGNTYIYLAFAENPFKYANAR